MLVLAATYGVLRRDTRPLLTRAVAVVPLRNAGGDATDDFLRLALADEVITILSHARTLSVRPLAITSTYDGRAADVAEVMRDLRVGTAVSGYFSRTGERLRVSLEATDADSSRVIWRDQMDGPADSLIATEMQLSLRIRRGLLPALGTVDAEGTPGPSNEEAYALFLKSIAIPPDTGPNPAAIAILEKSVALDPRYAPAWLALGRRYYVEARYATGDDSLLDRFDSAMERVIALDPGNVAATANLVAVATERGDLVRAFERAKALVQRRSDSVDAHYSLSYVLRYAGLLEPAGAECEQALLIDARTQSSGLRSCAVVFLLRSDYPRALNYIQLAQGSDFARAMSIHMRVREGKEREALAIGLPKIPQWRSYEMLLACAAKKPRAEIAALAQAVKPSSDPETNYFAAAHLAYCGETTAAIDLLSKAVAGHYCAVPAIDIDPLLASVRAAPGFPALRVQAADCQRTFVQDVHLK